MHLSLLFAFVLSLFHWFSEIYGKHVERYHVEIISFSAGVFITYIFLFLLPETIEGKTVIGNGVFFFMLLGFISFYLLEKYVYQHIKNKKELMKDLAEIHALGFFIDHFGVGMALYFSFNLKDIAMGALIFFPLLLHTVSSALSMNHIDEYFNKNFLLSLLLSIAPMMGVGFAMLLKPQPTAYNAFFCFVVGALIFVVVRDMIPKERAGSPKHFLIGLTLSIMLMGVVKLIILA